MEEKVFFENVRGQKLCGILKELNSDKDEVVIIVHGFSTHKNTTAKNCAEELEKLNISSFRIDLNGCGESEGLLENATISDYAEDVEAAIKFAKGKSYNKISLVGTSVGGTVCVVVATRNKIHRMLLRAPVSDYVSKKIANQGKEFIDQWKERGYNDYVKSDGTKLKINYSFLEDSKKHVMYDQVKDIRCPVLIIHGSNDDDTPVEQSKKVIKNFPNGRLIIIEGAGHKLEVSGDFSEGWKAFLEFFKNNNL